MKVSFEDLARLKGSLGRERTRWMDEGKQYNVLS